MMLPKWAVALMMLLFNSLAGLAAMNLFPAGSKGAVALSVASMLLGNMLAVFGIPLTHPGDPAPAPLALVPPADGEKK